MEKKKSLKIDLGYASLAGLRTNNEDYCAGVTPDGDTLDNKGVLVAIADGVGGHANGREASEFCVRGLLADYYSTPDTWSIPQSLEKVISALNIWLYSHSKCTFETAGMATTLSAIVIRGTRYTIAHVGDTRIYRLRDREMSLLTVDHIWKHPELNNVLSRAIGLDTDLSIDFYDGNLAENDIFLLVSDGVWNTLDSEQLIRLLEACENATDTASRIVLSAIKNGSEDNCTASIIKIKQLPSDKLRDNVLCLAALPLPPKLKTGQLIDGLEVIEVIHNSRITILYRVRDTISHQQYILKTLHENADTADMAAIAYEEWLTRRVISADFPQAINWSQRSCLYYLTTWHEGATLSRHLEMGRSFTSIEIADVAIRTLKALTTLHKLGIVHRDIKPDNLHLGADGKLRLLDLGVAASDGHDAKEIFNEINNPGTPSFMAPELFNGIPANNSSDLYAVGVSIYYLLTRKYPYGEIEPFQTPRFGDPIPPTRYRPDIPEWLESIILKAVARESQDRFETAEEFIIALERGSHRPLRINRHSPLLNRNPNLVIKLLLATSLVLNAILLFLLR
ncbi:MAG: bifunctional protein-serine/threonine kinase/phosphatase [Betaproteobacteria bacterium]|nr:bifunctional protein-serine/threonine kinase/phosphatase [Betaproteobacteria bacterium]